MDWEQAHVLIHALIHGPIELSEWRQVLTDLVLLVGSLLEQTGRDDKADVLPVNQDLRKALVDAPHAVGHVLEAHTVEYGLLDARHEAKFEMLGDLTNLAEDGQIANQLVIAP